MKEMSELYPLMVYSYLLKSKLFVMLGLLKICYLYPQGDSEPEWY